jgi:SMI1-KNR4 cell-wall
MRSPVWRVPAYLPYLQPPLRADAVIAAEEQLDVTLPQSYLNLLRQQNGGYLHCTLPDSEVPHSMIWGIGPHFPSITDYHEQLDPETAEAGAWVPPKSERLVPFDGDGHWYLCLDYRSNSVPCVSYVDLELEQDRQVAASFDEYLQSLRPEMPKSCLGVVQELQLDNLGNALGKALGVGFDDQGDQSQGYRTIRAAMGTKLSPAWVWISPNLVPRGFVRPSDQRFAELAGVLPGTCLRAPEFPSVTYFVEYTEVLAPQVLAALAKTGIPHQRLGDA